MSTRRQWRQHHRLAERGRHLASAREDLIAAGADPAELPIPLHPVPPGPIRGRVWVGPATLGLPAERLPIPAYQEHLAALSRAWAIVACACVAAFAGCGSTTGAALLVNDALTWHSVVTASMAVLWAGGAVWAGIYAASLHRRSRDLRRPELRAVPAAHEDITYEAPEESP